MLMDKLFCMERDPLFLQYKEVFDNYCCVDFRRRSQFRTFKMMVGNSVFYINSHILSTASPVFKAMLQSDFCESRDHCVRLEDENPQEVECLLQSICPFYMDIYPKLIDSGSLPSLLRMSDKFIISDLTHSCMQYLSRANFSNESPLLLLKIFHVIREQDVDYDIQTRILVQLLKHNSRELMGKSKKLLNSSTAVIVRNLIKHKSLMRHRVCYGEEVQGLQCTGCRVLTNRNRSHRLHFCSACRSELCQRCRRKICTKVVGHWLRELDDRED